MAFLPGANLAGFRIVRLIGAGRFADVYEAIAPEGRRALKVLRGETEVTSKIRARLGQESETLASIESVNVVRFHAVGDEDGVVWLLIELVEGHDLAQLAREAGGRLPVERAVRLVRQACEGVCAAHKAGVVHRDLSPANILITGDDLAKVGDFGSAKPTGYGVATTHEQDVSSSLTKAPEYAKTGKATPQSDVYSMGLVLHEILAGVHPIAPRAMTAIEIAKRHLEIVPPPLSSLRGDVPGDLSHLVERALAKDPAARPTMRALADELALVLQRLHAPRRALARSLQAPDPELGLAPTEPSLAAVGPHGTMPMAAVDSRPATLPPAPARMPEAPRPLPVTRAMPATVAMPEVGGQGDRRTTAIPVESEAGRASNAGGRRWLRWAVAVAATLGIGLAGAGWWLAGQGDGRTGSRPAPAASTAPQATASATGTGSARPVPGRGKARPRSP